MTTTPAGGRAVGSPERRDTLMAGFTTCREMGPTWPTSTSPCETRSTRERCPGRASSWRETTSRRPAAPATRGSSRSTWTCRSCSNLADGPEEVTKAVRTNIKNGADFVKILVTGAILSKGISARSAAVFGRRDPGRGHRGEPLGSAGRGARARREGNQGGDPRRRSNRRSRFVPGRRSGRPAAAERAQDVLCSDVDRQRGDRGRRDERSASEVERSTPDPGDHGAPVSSGRWPRACRSDSPPTPASPRTARTPAS